MNEERIGILISIEGGEKTAADIAKIDDKLGGIGKSLKDVRSESAKTAEELKQAETNLKALENEGKEGTKAYNDLKKSAEELNTQLENQKKTTDTLIVAQREEREQRKKLNSELNKQIRDFKKFGDAIPTDSIEGLARRYSELRRDLRLVPKNIRDIADQFGRNEVALKKLDPAIESAVRSYVDMQDEAKKTKGEILDFDNRIDDFTSNIGNYKSALDGLNLGGIIGKAGLGIAGIASGGLAGGLSVLGLPSIESLQQAAAFLGPAGIIGSALAGTAVLAIGYADDVTKEYEQLFSTVTKVTGAVGQDIIDVTARGKALSETFGIEFERVLESLNNTQKGFGTGFNETLDQIELGLLNLGTVDQQGQFLDSLREYPKLIANAGFSLEDFVKIQVRAAQQGVFDDKAIDSIKEADISLKEFTKTQSDAISGVIGEEASEDLKKRIREGETTTREAILEIDRLLEESGADYQDYATITADVFKGAGEDAGGFLEVLDLVKATTEDLDIPTDAYTTRLINQKDATEELNTEQAELARQLAGMGTTFEILKTQAQSFATDALGDVLLGFRIFSKQLEDDGLLAALFDFGEGARKAQNEIVAADNAALNEVEQGIKKRKELEDAEVIRKREQAAQTRALNKSLAESAKEREKAEKEALREIEKAEKLATKEKEKAAKEAAKIAKEIADNRIKASDNIADLEKKNEAEIAKALGANLTSLAEYQRQAELLRDAAIDSVGSLVGDPEQIAEQTKLIEEQLSIQLQALENKRNEALKKEEEARDKRESESGFSSLENQSNVDSLAAINDFNNNFDVNSTDEERIAAEEQLYDRLLQIELEYLEQKKLLTQEDGNISDEDRILKLQEIAEREKEINLEKNQEIIDNETAAAEKRIALQQRTADITASAIEGIGSSIGDFLGDQDKDVKEFYKSLVVTAIKALEAFLIASVTAQSLAQPDSVATFGLTGAARAAVLTGLIKAAFSVVRGAIGQLETGGVLGDHNMTELRGNLSNYMTYANGGAVNFPSRTGGIIKGPSHKDGGVKFKRIASGKMFLGEARGGEGIFNERQMAGLMHHAGTDIFDKINFPGWQNIKGATSAGNLHRYDSGGFIPQIISNGQIQSQAQVNATVRIPMDQLREQAMIMAEEIGNKQLEVIQTQNTNLANALSLALDDNNRLKERIEAAQNNSRT